MAVVRGTAEKDDAEAKLRQQQAEERKLAEMMIPKKKKQLYKKIMFGRKRKVQEVSSLVLLCQEMVYISLESEDNMDFLAFSSKH